MSRKNAVAIFTSLFLFGIVNTCCASDSLSKKYPSAVLVQLRSEHNRIEALLKEKSYKDAEEVQNDASEVRSRMIMDFQVNFSYCPVYYYIDTNADLIRQKKFDGVLMDGDGRPAKKLVIDNAHNNYIIVYFGYPVNQPYNVAVGDSAVNISNSEEPSGKSLVINNDKFEQIGYIYKLGVSNLFASRKNDKFSYSSKHYDIEYIPLAGSLNTELKDKKPPKIKARYKGK